VHVPFCDVRCPYCHFTCFASRDAELFDRWADAIVAQFARMREHFGVSTLVSVYFGGGTPTALTPSARATVTRWAGVNRLSLGLQSMDDGVLKFLGRLNTRASNRRTLDLACSLVENVSVDLIAATPADSESGLLDSIDQMLEWPVRHVSAYLLEIHAATRFGRDLRSGKLVPSPDDEQAATYRKLVERLGERGLGAYELSNFAQPGFEAWHNRRYWLRQPYLGVGPSAHSNVGRYRWAEIRDTSAWARRIEQDRVLVEDREELSEAARLEEQVLLGLRLTEGIPIRLVAGRERLVEEFVRAGLLGRQADRVFATVDGWLLLDQIVARLTT
jgi:oxygen-independent coproporphyrinogen-3 oxidase